MHLFAMLFEHLDLPLWLGCSKGQKLVSYGHNAQQAINDADDLVLLQRISLGVECTTGVDALPEGIIVALDLNDDSYHGGGKAKPSPGHPICSVGWK